MSNKGIVATVATVKGYPTVKYKTGRLKMKHVRKLITKLMKQKP